MTGRGHVSYVWAFSAWLSIMVRYLSYNAVYFSIYFDATTVAAVCESASEQLRSANIAVVYTHATAVCNGCMQQYCWLSAILIWHARFGSCYRIVFNNEYINIHIDARDHVLQRGFWNHAFVLIHVPPAQYFLWKWIDEVAWSLFVWTRGIGSIAFCQTREAWTCAMTDRRCGLKWLETDMFEQYGRWIYLQVSSIVLINPVFEVVNRSANGELVDCSIQI